MLALSLHYLFSSVWISVSMWHQSESSRSAFLTIQQIFCFPEHHSVGMQGRCSYCSHWGPLKSWTPWRSVFHCVQHVFSKEQKIVATEGRHNYYTLYINIIGRFSLPTCVEWDPTWKQATVVWGRARDWRDILSATFLSCKHGKTCNMLPEAKNR